MKPPPKNRSEPDERIGILFAIDNLRPGGAQKILLAILQQLDRGRFDPTVWRLGGGSGIEEGFAQLGVPVLAYPAWQMRTGIGLARMFRWMRRKRPSLVQTFLFHADIAGRILARAAGVPAVLSSVRASNVDKARWQLALDRATARLADRIVAVSEATRAFAVAKEGAPPERTITIPNGIDLGAYCPCAGRAEARAELGYDDQHFVVGAIGRLTAQKDHQRLIEAVSRLAGKLPDLHAFIAGYGPLGGQLQGQIARMGLAGRVQLLGYRSDVPRLLAAMDAFALPSLWEGMPNALLEAMAMAVPAVATAVDGSAELVVDGKTGILAPPGDARALAAAIERLARSPELAAQMGRSARERAKRHFDLGRCTEQYVALYEELLERRTMRKGRAGRTSQTGQTSQTGKTGQTGLTRPTRPTPMMPIEE